MEIKEKILEKLAVKVIDLINKLEKQKESEI